MSEIRNKYKDIIIHDIEDMDDVLDLVGIALCNGKVSGNEYLAIYSTRTLIRDIFAELLSEGYEFGYVNMDMLDNSLTNTPYVLFIRGNCIISIEPALSAKGEIMQYDAKICYIDMDNIKQNIVDYCVNSDKHVELFGHSDDECDCDCCACHNGSITTDEDTKFTTFHKHKAVGDGYSSITFSSTDADLVKEFAKLYK